VSKKIVDHMAKFITSNMNIEELEQVERIVQEAKRSIAPKTEMGYWEGRTSCWQMNSCPSYIRNECPAYKLRSGPCWEMEGTYCKLNDFGSTGVDTSICQICRVYKAYGNDEPIEIKLFGRGIDPNFIRYIKDEV
jgi:hypothetical protein